jgi:hypothetical protein
MFVVNRTNLKGKNPETGGISCSNCTWRNTVGSSFSRKKKVYTRKADFFNILNKTRKGKRIKTICAKNKMGLGLGLFLA